MKDLNRIFNLLFTPLHFLIRFLKKIEAKFYTPKLKFILLTLFSFFLVPTAIHAGPKTVSINDVTLNEGDSGTTTFTFIVTTTDHADGDSVDWTTVDGSATSDDDFISASGTVTFSGTDRTESISISVKGDTDSEPPFETFTVVLSNPSGGGIQSIADGTGLGTIIDDELKDYTLTAGSIVIDESLGTANVPIRVDPAIYDDTSITVSYSTSNDTAIAGLDYSSTSGSITITAADTVNDTTIVNIPITIIDDSTEESQEIFNLVLDNNPTITSTINHTVTVATDTGSITINDNDSIGALPTISVNDVTGNEGDINSFLTFTVSLSSILTQEVVFSYATSGDTATSNVDFISRTGTATIPPNTSNITIPITVIGDLEAGEGNEQLKLVISTNSPLVSMGKDVGIGTIIDNDTGLSLSLNDAAIAERDFDITANVNIVFSQALTADMNLTYSTSDGTASSPSDYNGTNTDITVTIPAGSTVYPLTFNIVGDNIEESNEEFTINIESVTTTETLTIAKDTGTVTIFDDDADIGCSSYIGLMTINEYQNNPNYKDDYGHPQANQAGFVPGNYIEIKYLDFLVKQYVNDLWSVAVYTTAGSHQLYWNERDDACIDPRYEVFQMDNNVMGKEGYVVLRDHNGNEVDVLNILNSNHYAQQCHDFVYDTDFESSAQNKDLFRDPDGTGDWYDHGSGANSGGSRCINRDGFGGLLFTKFDAIDAGVSPSTPIQNGGDVPIQTKVVSQSFLLDILSLDPATGFLIDSTINVRTYLADGITGERLPDTVQSPNNPVIVTFAANNTIQNQAYSYNSARQNVRLRFEYCGNDQGAYEDWDTCWLNNDVVSQSNRRVSHSRNAFAIRPKHFTISTTSNHYPDLLRAGQDYDLTIQALDFLDNNSNDYNQTKSNIETNATRYFNDMSADDGTLHGDLTWSATDFNITDGISLYNGSNEVAGIQYSDIGKINIVLRDKLWAAVDNDDTPQDCTSASHTWICEESPPTVVRFIPDHFTLSNSVNTNKTAYLYNHQQKLLTYLSSDLNMSAHIDVTISAMNANEAVTQNFHSGDTTYYENTVSVGINLTPSLHPLNNSEIIHDIPTPTMLGFGAPDDDGTHRIPWNETDETQRLMFNYQRDNNGVVNPFVVDGSDVNLTVESIYTGTAPEGTATIKGSALSDADATFAFARAKSSKFFYDNVLASSVNTPISVVLYCDTFPTCTEFSTTIQVSGKINEPYWWLSFEHDEATDDGNITLQTGTITPGTGSATVTNAAVVDTFVNAIDNTVAVNNTSGTTPMTVEIDLDTSTPTSTNSWLIYNPNGLALPPPPFYKVRFIGQSGWSGHGKTGHVVDSNASKVINKRLSW